MKLYRSLSDTIANLKRKPHEVIAIISFNGQAYFIFRSNPSSEIATLKQVQAKLEISNELLGQDIKTIDIKKRDNLYQLMSETGIPLLFPASNHAEENLIRGFPDILKQFKSTFPEQKIITITLFLTHSPCSEKGEKRHSDACHINQFFLPEGCDKKLAVFFTKGHYKNTAQELFAETKFRVQYLKQFNHTVEIEKEFSFVNKADPLLESLLCQKLNLNP